VEKVGHDLKHALLPCGGPASTLRGLEFDSMIASYVLDPGRREHSLESLALEHFGVKLQTLRGAVRQGGRGAVGMAECAWTMTGRSRHSGGPTAAAAAGAGPEMPRLHLDALCRDMELPLIEVLAEMEWNGIRIDVDFFREMSTAGWPGTWT
jgi:DNA polymerase I